MKILSCMYHCWLDWHSHGVSFQENVNHANLLTQDRFWTLVAGFDCGYKRTHSTLNSQNYLEEHIQHIIYSHKPIIM